MITLYNTDTGEMKQVASNGNLITDKVEAGNMAAVTSNAVSKVIPKFKNVVFTNSELNFISPQYGGQVATVHLKDKIQSVNTILSVTCGPTTGIITYPINLVYNNNIDNLSIWIPSGDIDSNVVVTVNVAYI